MLQPQWTRVNTDQVTPGAISKSLVKVSNAMFEGISPGIDMVLGVISLTILHKDALLFCSLLAVPLSKPVESDGFYIRNSYQKWKLLMVWLALLGPEPHSKHSQPSVPGRTFTRLRRMKPTNLPLKRWELFYHPKKTGSFLPEKFWTIKQ